MHPASGGRAQARGQVNPERFDLLCVGPGPTTSEDISRTSEKTRKTMTAPRKKSSVALRREDARNVGRTWTVCLQPTQARRIKAHALGSGSRARRGTTGTTRSARRRATRGAARAPTGDSSSAAQAAATHVGARSAVESRPPVMACPPVLRALHELYHGGGWLIRSWVQLG